MRDLYVQSAMARKSCSVCGRGSWLFAVALLAGCIGGSSSASRAEIAFARIDPGNTGIFVMNADGSGQKQLTDFEGQRGDYDPAWSPDGKRIAFASDQGSPNFSDILVMDADGSHRTRLTAGPALDSSPTWSPDGERIAFERSGGLFVMNADGSGEKRLAVDVHVEDPAWSPDGTKIAFGRNEIYVVSVDGNSLENLTNTEVVAGAGYENKPAWSPDGKRIAFVSNRGPGGDDIFVMNADGSDQTNLTKSEPHEGSPAWSPDGKRILFDVIGGARSS